MGGGEEKGIGQRAWLRRRAIFSRPRPIDIEPAAPKRLKAAALWPHGGPLAWGGNNFANLAEFIQRL
jgi:hypothetical protein